MDLAKVLQCNLNHCRNAQHLLMQSIAENGVGLAIVAEPYAVPDHPRWFGDNLGSVAVYWAGRDDMPPCNLITEHSCFR